MQLVLAYAIFMLVVNHCMPLTSRGETLYCALLLAIIRRWPSPPVSHRQEITVLLYSNRGRAALINCPNAAEPTFRLGSPLPQARPFQTALKLGDLNYPSSKTVANYLPFT